MKPLVFFVDPLWKRDDASHTPLLFPFWGKKFWKNVSFTSGIFERYSFDTDEYAIVNDIAIADAILLPYRYDIVRARFPEIVKEAEALSAEHTKMIIIDAIGDEEYAVPVKNSIVLRYGGYRFLKKPNEIIVPPYADDLLERCRNGILSIRKKSARPVIGFAGWAEVSLAQRMRSLLRELPIRARALFDTRYRACRKGIFIRRRVLDLFSKSDLVEKNFLVRGSYSGNVKTAEKDVGLLRNEFVENALASDLALDIRGDANASTRLFEILSLGRVPLIIDTERNFPFSEKIDYESFSIIVDQSDIAQLPRIARGAYDALSEAQWEDMQRKARAAYQEWFRVDVMTKHLMRAIRKKIEAH
ncbi:MAG: exostosin family protein [Minisyncoccia bacterium]